MLSILTRNLCFNSYVYWIGLYIHVYQQLFRKTRNLKQTMKFTIHKWAWNVIAVTNPTRYSKFDKYIVTTQESRFVWNCSEILISCFFCFYVWSGLDLLGSLIAQLWNLPAMSQFSRKNATEWRQERFQLEFCEWIKHAESCAWLAKSSGDVSTYSSCTLSHPATEPHSGLTQSKLLLATHV